MSNWSLVIVLWSGIDDRAAAAADGHERRLQEIVTQAGTPPCVLIPDCGSDGAPGGACEFAAATHINHFLPEALINILRGMDWEYPEEVCVIWKNELMELPEVVAME